MSHDDDLYGIIKKVIAYETIFLRHYVGKVVSNSDPSKKGRVKVMIKEMGFDTDAMSLWCWPRQGNGMSVPKNDSYVEVYFLAGDSGRPVYLFPAAEVSDNTPSKFTGTVSMHVLFQDPSLSDNYITFDSQKKLYDQFGKVKLDLSKKEFNVADKLKVDFDQGKINMLSATKKFVLGDDLDDWITNTLKVFADTHTHLYNPGPGAPAQTGVAASPLTAPTNYLSTDIKGS